MRIDREGRLMLGTRFGEVALAGLQVYQAGDGKEVSGCFVRRGAGWGIEVGSYDRTQTLVIDPLVYSTYLGGSSLEEGRGIAVDGSGQAYVTGETWSVNFDIRDC